MAAVLNTDHAWEGFLQVHPAWASPGLEEEMIETAEERLAVVGEDGRRRLRLWAGAENEWRKAILRQRGYVKKEWVEYQRRRPLSLPVPDVKVAEGYVVRPLGDVAELPARSWLSWLAFHPDEPAERYEGWEWYPNVQRAPLYRRDLDIVGVAPDGELAAFCTVWFDDVTRVGAFEPVGTAPAHQRKGLGKAVMTEGLRRVQRLGATLATVGSYSAEAGALYHAMGFVEYDLNEPWVKEWQT
jgi:GNAT superfamily N-acetyltransferase